MLIDGYAWGLSPSCSSQAAVSATQGYAWLPLAGATLVFMGVNGMKWSELRDDTVSGDARAAAKARVFLLVLLFVACACIAGAGFLMSDKCVGLMSEKGVVRRGG